MKQAVNAVAQAHAFFLGFKMNVRSAIVEGSGQHDFQDLSGGSFFKIKVENFIFYLFQIGKFFGKLLQARRFNGNLAGNFLCRDRNIFVVLPYMVQRTLGNQKLLYLVSLAGKFLNEALNARAFWVSNGKGQFFLLELKRRESQTSRLFLFD
ncbi:MAG: hypothetical protein UY12_C0039G0005 [Parcubacteria group bacterium GW2011_GWA2_47_8b]|nr:MAG: hypothetical protein UY12_C0039G0005 [Parcubacteria group bacterium GW2011_GWA2_47_8b]